MDQLDPFPEDFCLLPYYAGSYKAHEGFSAFGGIFVYTGAFQNF